METSRKKELNGYKLHALSSVSMLPACWLIAELQIYRHIAAQVQATLFHLMVAPEPGSSSTGDPDIQRSYEVLPAGEKLGKLGKRKP